MDITEFVKSIDIVEYISQFIELTQKGDEWWGLSCFKEEKTPSFSVRRDPPVFFDYSSGIGGNLYTFVRYYNNCSSVEAIDILKKYAGTGENLSKPHEKLAATITCKKFAKQKATQKPAASKILPDNYMERYEIRHDKTEIWRSEGISQASMDKFQVRYDSFSDRIVYPIRNTTGKIVNIGGRTLDPMWKEKGQRKYCYFYPWGTLDTIYGLAENIEAIKKSREIILFEGCKSVLVADSWGIHNTGAILTSHLNPNQMKILAKLGCRVVFALDKEVDVTKDHNINRLKQYVNVEYVYDTDNLLDEKDSPVDKGLDAFKKVYTDRRKLK